MTDNRAAHQIARTYQIALQPNGRPPDRWVAVDLADLVAMAGEQTVQDVLHVDCREALKRLESALQQRLSHLAERRDQLAERTRLGFRSDEPQLARVLRELEDLASGAVRPKAIVRVRASALAQLAEMIIKEQDHSSEHAQPALRIFPEHHQELSDEDDSGTDEDAEV